MLFKCFAFNISIILYESPTASVLYMFRKRLHSAPIYRRHGALVQSRFGSQKARKRSLRNSRGATIRSKRSCRCHLKNISVAFSPLLSLLPPRSQLSCFPNSFAVLPQVMAFVSLFHLKRGLKIFGKLLRKGKDSILSLTWSFFNMACWRD